MTTTLEAASRWTADGIGYGRAVVVRVVGPAAFEAGAVLLAADDGRIAGSVSPGCVDGAVAEAVVAARSAMGSSVGCRLARRCGRLSSARLSNQRENGAMEPMQDHAAGPRPPARGARRPTGEITQ